MLIRTPYNEGQLKYGRDYMEHPDKIIGDPWR